MLTMYQKDVYEGMVQKIRDGGGLVVFPLQIGEAVGSNDRLKHNGLSMREIARRVQDQMELISTDSA